MDNFSKKIAIDPGPAIRRIVGTPGAKRGFDMDAAELLDRDPWFGNVARYAVRRVGMDPDDAAGEVALAVVASLRRFRAGAGGDPVIGARLSALRTVQDIGRRDRSRRRREEEYARRRSRWSGFDLNQLLSVLSPEAAAVVRATIEHAGRPYGNPNGRRRFDRTTSGRYLPNPEYPRGPIGRALRAAGMTAAAVRRAVAEIREALS